MTTRRRARWEYQLKRIIFWRQVRIILAVVLGLGGLALIVMESSWIMALAVLLVMYAHYLEKH